jgi:protein-S-isoprenylcysteine O-methyltransferase Ste14
VGKTRAIVVSYVGVLVYASFVFIGAWKLAYWQGWLYVALAVLGTTIGHALTPPDSDLAERRTEETGAGQEWDRRLLKLFFLVNVVMFLVAGADSGRFGWSGSVPLFVTLAGAALMIAGQTLFAMAKRENAFFSATVRIQTEHGHAVCDTGLYRLVRHPGYLGMLLTLLAFPLVMNSYWAFVPALLGAAILVARTMLEDRFLARELAGYAEYATTTRFMLIPGLL